MPHYDFADRFRQVYDKAVLRHREGRPNDPAFLDAADTRFLAANGLTVQNLFDYAEDHNDGGEPGFERALAIEMVRRDYFLNVQNGQASQTVIDGGKLPPKDAAVENIRWLPRLIPKTKAKLRGELPANLMYSCGGDRAFFKQHDIHPAEFLALVWRNEQDDRAIIDWVVRRSKAAGGG